MLEKGKDGKANTPKHYVYEYIEKKLEELHLSERDLFDKSIISRSELIKLKNGEREGLTSRKFYKLYTGFGDSPINAALDIYPNLDLTMGEYIPPKRNEFGKLMSKYEVSENSPEEIAEKTGIPLPRIRQIYFKTGSPEAYELLLIERAVGKNSGELFEKFYKDKAGSR